MSSVPKVMYRNDVPPGMKSSSQRWRLRIFKLLSSKISSSSTPFFLSRRCSTDYLSYPLGRFLNSVKIPGRTISQQYAESWFILKWGRIMVLAVSKVIKGSSAIVIPITPVIQIPSDQLRDSFSFSTMDQLLGAAANKHSSPHLAWSSSLHPKLQEKVFVGCVV